jgi:hypothetical protein
LSLKIRSFLCGVTANGNVEQERGTEGFSLSKPERSSVSLAPDFTVVGVRQTQRHRDCVWKMLEAHSVDVWNDTEEMHARLRRDEDVAVRWFVGV